MTDGGGGLRCAVVTGAASGIGAASARLLAADGWAVVCVDVAQDLLAGVVTAIQADGGRATAVVGDVSDESTWADVRHTLTVEGWAAGALVSNAYTVTVAPLLQQSSDDWHRQLDVNLTAAFHGVRALLEDLVRTRGAVVLVSSVHALVGLPGHPAYAASKGALTALARQLAVEYGPEVRVNSVLPGPVRTAAWDRVAEEDRRTSVAGTAAGRFGEPEEVAEVIAFLVGDRASFVTGHAMVVDGGWSIVKSSS